MSPSFPSRPHPPFLFPHLTSIMYISPSPSTTNGIPDPCSPGLIFVQPSITFASRDMSNLYPNVETHQEDHGPSPSVPPIASSRLAPPPRPPPARSPPPSDSPVPPFFFPFRSRPFSFVFCFFFSCCCLIAGQRKPRRPSTAAPLEIYMTQITLLRLIRLTPLRGVFFICFSYICGLVSEPFLLPPLSLPSPLFNRPRR